MADSGTVFVVDDDASVRRSLARLLRSDGFTVELFKNAEVLIARGRPAQPTCVILDMALPGATGLELQAHLRGIGSSMGIVFLSGRSDVRTSVRAMKGGAVDFLTKPVDDVELLAAVRRALSVDVERTTVRDRMDTIRRRVRVLTNRERTVFDLVVSGLLNKQIASQLGIAVKTVKVHRARVMQKMSVKSVAELARMAETIKSSDAPAPAFS